jgi:hypothetical protein
VGYEEHRIGWRVRDLTGKYFFSNDVLFNESSSGRLGVSRPIASSERSISDVLSPQLARDTPCMRTAAGRAYDEVIRLKDFSREQ